MRRKLPVRFCLVPIALVHIQQTIVRLRLSLQTYQLYLWQLSPQSVMLVVATFQTQGA